MLTIEDIQKYDKGDMHSVYDKWPKLAEQSYETEYNGIEFKDIDHIVFSGMGGSGTICDLFSSVLSKTNLHVNVIKGYLLPKTVDNETLVISISVSGDTAETISALKEAKKQHSKIIAFSSGGKMEALCKKNNIEYRKINMFHSPRASFITYVYAILKILDSIIPIEKQEIINSIKELKKTSKEISASNLTHTNQAINLASWISGIPLIYFPWGLQAAAVRFKNSIQENAKSHAVVENVIEACHNGIVSWEKPSNVQPILLQGKDDYFKTKERWQILKEYFNKNNIPFYEINSVEGGILSKLSNLIYFFDYTSIYYAILSKIDPSPIKSIDFIKQKLV